MRILGQRTALKCKLLHVGPLKGLWCCGMLVLLQFTPHNWHTQIQHTLSSTTLNYEGQWRSHVFITCVLAVRSTVTVRRPNNTQKERKVK
jgi:hypothetical protein